MKDTRINLPPVSKDPFSYKRKLTIEIKGDFRSGGQLQVFKLALKDFESDHLTLDLSKVNFMDSDSYRLVWEHVHEGKGSIIFDEESKVYQRYIDWCVGK